jgi:hypothetical protein
MGYKMKKYGGVLKCADGSEPTEVEEKGEKPKVEQSQTGLDEMDGGRHRRHSRRHHHRRRKTLRPVPKGTHVKAKTLRRLLKSKGLKVSGKKSTLRARARKAHLIRGGSGASSVPSSTGANI